MSDLPPGAKEKFKVLGVRVDQVGGPVGWWGLDCFYFYFLGELAFRIHSFTLHNPPPKPNTPNQLLTLP